MEELNNAWDEVRFWSQIVTDAEHTIFCSPDLESRIKGWVDARLMGGILKVVATPFCPPNQIIVVDHNAMQASLNKPIKWPYSQW